MPIMDGYDACERIYQYIFEENNFFAFPSVNKIY